MFSVTTALRHICKESKQDLYLAAVPFVLITYTSYNEAAAGAGD